MVLYGVSKRTENYPEFAQLLLHRGSDRYGVEYSVDSNSRKCGALLQRNAQLLEGFEHFRVYVVEAFRGFVHALGSSVVVNVLVVDAGVVDHRPVGFGFCFCELHPVAICLEAPLKQPFGLFLLRRNEANDVFAQPLRCKVSLNISNKSPLVFSA